MADASENDPWIRAHEIGEAAFCEEAARLTRRQELQNQEAQMRMRQGIQAHEQWLDQTRPPSSWTFAALIRVAILLALLAFGLFELIRRMGSAS